MPGQPAPTADDHAGPTAPGAIGNTGPTAPAAIGYAGPTAPGVARNNRRGYGSITSSLSLVARGALEGFSSLPAAGAGAEAEPGAGAGVEA